MHFFLFLSSKCIVQGYFRACYRIGFPVSTNLLDHPLPAFSESFPSPPPSTTSGASGDLDFPHSEHRLHTLLQWTLMVIFWHLVISLHIEKSISPWNFPSAIHEDILSEQGLQRTTANPSFSRSTTVAHRPTDAEQVVAPLIDQPFIHLQALVRKDKSAPEGKWPFLTYGQVSALTKSR